jgi:hypothetical protein
LPDNATVIETTRKTARRRATIPDSRRSHQIIDLVEKANRLRAVPDDMYRDGKLGGGDGFLDQKHIGLIVLDDEDLVMRDRGRFFRSAA